MDSKLIDDLLIELLQLPTERRTEEKILANLTLAATAAGVSLSSKGATLQMDHLQLAAALDRLAATLGDSYRARATLRLGGGLDGVELCAVIEPHDSRSLLPRFISTGSTARAALAGINAEIRSMNQPTPTPPRNLGGRLTLKRLQTKLDQVAEA